MLIVISPAKSLNMDPLESIEHTLPRLNKTQETLSKIMSKKSKKDLMSLMHISENIAELNVDRFKNWQDEHKLGHSKQSVFAFNGDVYQGLGIQDFSDADLSAAQDQLRILSGLYGLLRPLDLMQPYRLEMGTRLAYRNKKNLYDFWGSQITELINHDISELGHDALINLASQEYFKSIKTKDIKVPIVNIHFKEWRAEKLKIISFSAKRARGIMSRYIIKNRLKSIEAIKGFDLDNYTFDESRSDNHNLTFTR